MQKTSLVLMSLAFVACANGVYEDATTVSQLDADAGGHLGPSSSAPAGRPVDSGAGDASEVAPQADAGAASASDAAGVMDAADAQPDGALTGSTWASPTCDGVISAAEYGGVANQQHTSGGQTWSLAWNATNLYVGLDGANLTEGSVLYVGHSLSGSASGQAYDGARAATLPFHADAVIYAKQGYAEVRGVSSGTWGAPVTSVVTFCGSASTRELVIPWSALGAAALPASFRWLGYSVSATGFVYATEPATLPAGFIGTSAAFAHDQLVASTANGSGSFAFQTVE